MLLHLFMKYAYISIYLINKYHDYVVFSGFDQVKNIDIM